MVRRSDVAHVRVLTGIANSGLTGQMLVHP